jgi:hypothetical protein
MSLSPRSTPNAPGNGPSSGPARPAGRSRCRRRPRPHPPASLAPGCPIAVPHTTSTGAGAAEESPGPTAPPPPTGPTAAPPARPTMDPRDRSAGPSASQNDDCRPEDRDAEARCAEQPRCKCRGLALTFQVPAACHAAAAVLSSAAPRLVLALLRALRSGVRGSGRSCKQGCLRCATTLLSIGSRNCSAA